MSKPGTMELSRAVGISKSHASGILSDNPKKVPSIPLAIRIYRATGWKPSTIEDLTDEQIDVLEQVELKAA